jgi:hypothetical protein
MATKKPRVSVTFDEDTASLLSYLARKKSTSVANIVRALTLEALEIHEDAYFCKITAGMDLKNMETFSHEEAWGASRENGLLQKTRLCEADSRNKGEVVRRYVEPASDALAGRRS